MTEQSSTTRLLHVPHGSADAWEYAGQMVAPQGDAMADWQQATSPWQADVTAANPVAAVPASPAPAQPHIAPLAVAAWEGSAIAMRAVADVASAAAIFGHAMADVGVAPTPTPTTGTLTSGATTASVSNAGATAMNAPQTTSTYDVTGAGIIVGILSSSFAGTSSGASEAAGEEADGDLPGTVKVLADDSGSTADEGRAMAELVHAVAPGATIDFATAEGGDQTFANNILALAAAGAKIIVDDVTYFDEPFFQVGSALQNAIETVVAEGVSYFTSASNEGSNYYQSAISLVTDTLPGGTTGMSLVNFGTAEAATSGRDTLQQITFATNVSISIDLQWTQPFQSISGTGSAYSLALYLYQDGTLVGSSTTADTGNDPVQVLSFTSTGSSDPYELAIAMNGGTLTSGAILKYIIYAGNTSDATIDDSAAGNGSGSVVGHELLANVNTVGAVAAGSSSVEPYSSVGPGDIYYNAGGTLLASPTATGKVDFLAPDGISTSVSGFSAFYGTSAAAPDAAAAAALLLEINPNLSPAEISAALASTATAISGAATLTGSGLVDVDSAAVVAYGDGWTVAAGGTYATASAWANDAVPTSTTPVTLDDDLGTFSAAYTVTVDSTGAVAKTLTVGNDTDVAVTLAVSAGSSLGVAGGIYAGANGTILDSGTLAVAGSATVVTGGTLLDSGVVSVTGSLTGGGVTRLAKGSLLVLSTNTSTVLTTGLTGTLSVMGASTVDLSGLAYNGLYRVAYSAGALTVKYFRTLVAELHFATSTASGSYTFSESEDSTGGEQINVACFRRGTRIATPAGEVPVETLRIGDPVLTAGGAAPVRWIGRRAYPADIVAARRNLQPIRIAAGALGPLRPLRDLDLSAQHALLLPDIDGAVLVPAGRLVDGAGVCRLTAPGEVEYLHVMLDEHSVILADGVPCETFVDDGSRAMFDNAASYTGPVVPGPARFCAPRIGDGLALLRVRAAIAARSETRPGGFESCLDNADETGLAGWAHDALHPGAPVMLEVLVDGARVGAILADTYRGDLAEAGIGDGHSAFYFYHAQPLDRTRRHLVAVRRAGDGTGLNRSPMLLDRIEVSEHDTPEGDMLENDMSETGALLLDAALLAADDPVMRADLAAMLSRELGALRQLLT